MRDDLTTPHRKWQRPLEVAVIVSVAVLCGFVLWKADSEGTDPPVLDAAAKWQRDSIWHDGKAEYAVYRARRTIYGSSRSYEARIITNTQHMDPSTTTKAADWSRPGMVRVFKHNVSEIIPTENYDYRYLTTVFVRADRLSPFKVVMSSQEDCGSTYKQIVNASNTLSCDQFSYFPEEGHASSRIAMSGDVYLQDALTLVLRSFPFDTPPTEPVRIRLIPDLTDTHQSDLTPMDAVIKYVGRETLDVPIGSTIAHHLRVEPAKETTSAAGQASDYWFAAETGPDRLNVLVRYEGPFGVVYELESLKRWAYWERP